MRADSSALTLRRQVKGAGALGVHLAAHVDELRARGSKVKTIFPDSNSRDAFGVTMRDVSSRPPSAQAGYNQGKTVAEQLSEFWR